MPDSMEMPRYRHREIWALKIKEVQLVAGEGTPSSAKGIIRLVFENSTYAPIEVDTDADYARKHIAQAGGLLCCLRGWLQVLLSSTSLIIP
ncbi:unnamed protein product, partial [marine sediment metagenome]